MHAIGFYLLYASVAFSVHYVLEYCQLILPLLFGKWHNWVNGFYCCNSLFTARSFRKCNCLLDIACIQFKFGVMAGVSLQTQPFLHSVFLEGHYVNRCEVLKSSNHNYVLLALIQPVISSLLSPLPSHIPNLKPMI